jgi:hypothetical protein
MNHEFEKKLYGRNVDRAGMEQFGNPHHELCNVEDLTAFFIAGEEMGIKVRVLAQAGEKYNADHMDVAEDSSGTPVGASFDCSTHIVPKGKLYIEIGNEIRKMGKFYTKADVLSEQMMVPQKSA